MGANLYSLGCDVKGESRVLAVVVVMVLIAVHAVVEFLLRHNVLRLGLGLADHYETFILQLVDLLLSELTSLLIR